MPSLRNGLDGRSGLVPPTPTLHRQGTVLRNVWELSDLTGPITWIVALWKVPKKEPRRFSALLEIAPLSDVTVAASDLPPYSPQESLGESIKTLRDNRDHGGPMNRASNTEMRPFALKNALVTVFPRTHEREFSRHVGGLIGIAHRTNSGLKL